MAFHRNGLPPTLAESYTDQDVRDIAGRLTEAYPDHGFVIDLEECERLGLKTEEAEGKLADVLDTLSRLTANRTFLGQLVETEL